MPRYIPIWYDQDSTIQEDAPLFASSEEEAKHLLFSSYNGNPPGPLLYLEVIEE